MSHELADAFEPLLSDERVATAAIGITEDRIGIVEDRVVLRIAAVHHFDLDLLHVGQALGQQLDAGVELVVAGAVAHRTTDEHQLLGLGFGSNA